MSASWDSERLVRDRLHRLVAAPLSLVLAGIVLAALLLAPGAEARRTHREARDTTRVIQKITVNDRGVEIVHSKDAHVSAERSGAVRIDVGDGDNASSDDEADEDAEASEGADTLDFDRSVRVGGHGITVDVDESGMVRMFSDAEVHAGERIEGDVVAVFGDVVVEGQVTGNAVSVFGSVRLEPGARIEGDAVAVGGVLDQPQGATVGGESVSLGFLPLSWGAPSVGMMLGFVILGWVVTMFVGWILFLLFPSRMLRTAVTASQRTGGSLVLGLLSGPLLIIAVVLLLVTVIGIPVALLLPLVYLLSLWAGQIALSYALGCRLTRRRMGEGGFLFPLMAGTLFVSAFFVLGTALARPEGLLRTGALFFHLLGILLVTGLSVIGVGAFLLSRFGPRPRDTEYRDSLVPAVAPSSGPAAPLAGGPSFVPPTTTSPGA